MIFLKGFHPNQLQVKEHLFGFDRRVILRDGPLLFRKKKEFQARLDFTGSIGSNSELLFDIGIARAIQLQYCLLHSGGNIFYIAIGRQGHDHGSGTEYRTGDAVVT